LVSSLIGAAGSASGATVQSIAAMRSWLMQQSWNALSFIGWKLCAKCRRTVQQQNGAY
jgi:hypothetical protein